MENLHGSVLMRVETWRNENNQLHVVTDPATQPGTSYPPDRIYDILWELCYGSIERTLLGVFAPLPSV